MEPLLDRFGPCLTSSATSSVLKPHSDAGQRELYLPGQILPVAESRVLVLTES